MGRGGKRGTYSGHGVKGQRSRAGRKLEPIVRQLIKRYPKLRGYRFKGRMDKPAIVNIDVLENKFKVGETVNPEILVEKGIIRRVKGKTPKVKILSRGDLKKKLIIEGCRISQGAKKKIEKSGSTIK